MFAGEVAGGEPEDDEDVLGEDVAGAVPVVVAFSSFSASRILRGSISRSRA